MIVSAILAQMTPKAIGWLTDDILTKNEIISILSTNEFDEILYKTADEVRKKYVGDDVHLRALIEFSNICKNNCLYCWHFIFNYWNFCSKSYFCGTWRPGV